MDAFGRIEKITVADGNTLEYIYSNGRLSQIKRTDTTAGKSYSYYLAYDAFGNLTSIKTGSSTLASYTYGAHNGLLTKQTYGNGDVVNFTYDNLGRTKTVSYGEGRDVSYTYNGEGRLHSIYDDKQAQKYIYTYDSLGRLVNSRRVNSSGQTQMMTSQEYNSANKLVKQSWQVGSDVRTDTYSYNSADSSVATLASGAGKTLTYGYDHLLRLSSVAAGAVYTKGYTYRDQSEKISSMQVLNLAYDTSASDISFAYTYDAVGNILTYTAPGKSTITYTYDSKNQLTKAAGSKTYTYTYDAFGNLLTASDGTTSHSYTYGNVNWPDRLEKYDGQTISYDGSGNPTSYYNGTRWTMQWEEGRNLVSANNGTTGISYLYDHNGQRTSKAVGDTIHTYYYASGKLLRETYGSTTLDFYYDASGTPFAIKHAGTVYYYITNLQGDVIRIVDQTGASVAEYEYSPFGEVISATGTLAAINPLRYRGYYYDTETGFYYVSSRYYDPEIGRFINADSLVSTGQGILGNNMFAYCNNNPVNYKDPNGQDPVTATITVTAAGVVTVVILVAGVAIASYCAVKALWEIGGWIADLIQTAWANISYAKEVEEPEPPDVTYPGDDPKTAPDGYEWRGPDEQGGERGGYANPDGKDSWHPDLDHPDGVKPHWDYNDGVGHKWRVFPDHIEFVPK